MTFTINYTTVETTNNATEEVSITGKTERITAREYDVSEGQISVRRIEKKYIIDVEVLERLLKEYGTELLTNNVTDIFLND